MSSKPAQGLSSQSRVVRCPKCHKFLQEPEDVTIYKCSGCNSILQAKRWDNDKDLLSSQNRSLSTEVESGEYSGTGSSKMPVRSSYRKYSSRTSPCFQTAYRRRHETTYYISRDWMRSASPSPSSYGYTSSSSPFQGSASEQSYHHQPNQFKHYGREGWFQEFSSSAAASPIRYQGETSSDQKCYHWSSQQSQMLHESINWSGVLELSSITKKEEGEVTRRSVSSEFYELKPEAFQPQWNHKSSEASGETSRIHLEQAHSAEPLDKNEHVWEANLPSEKYTRDIQEFDLGELKWDKIISSERVRYELEDARVETVYGGEIRWEETMEDRAGLHLEEYETNFYENYSNPFEWTSGEAQGRSESSSVIQECQDAKPDQSRYEIASERQELSVMVEDGPSLHLDKWGYESTTLEETFDGLTEESTPMFCLHEPAELGTLVGPDNEEADDGSSESSSTDSFNSHESSNMRAVFHQEEPQVVMSDSRTEMISVKLEDIFEWTSERAPTFHLYEPEPEPELGALLEDAYGRSESSSRGSFNDHVASSGSMVSSQGHEPGSIKAEGESEAEEEILRDHFKNNLHKESIVGLRHALYQTQTSPLSSPIHTPIGSSPLHIRMRSSMNNSHIVSPLRSPTNSSGSLSDVLFLAKKT
ncbi:uncharacterized protein LOC108861270 isoform X1 [Raphanus sativus]|uniref:Uncharacterized protein LOC108861270 isoform X1 n=2 Tax=Raphanus sativus TaxID=3726 RepID=A0A6J0P1S1_RAPSA|nr:uncharacterized protein LOC108861270 isoform X1 [Raphanus sativus]